MYPLQTNLKNAYFVIKKKKKKKKKKPTWHLRFNKKIYHYI